MSDRWRALAVASLTVNVIVLGLAIGVALSGARLAGPTGPATDARSVPFVGYDISPRALLGALPPGERRASVRRLAREGRSVRPLMQEARAARREALEAIAAPDLDAEAARAAFERSLEAEARLRLRGFDVMVEILAELPPETRLQAMQAARRHGPRVRFRGPRGPGGDPAVEPPLEAPSSPNEDRPAPIETPREE